MPFQFDSFNCFFLLNSARTNYLNTMGCFDIDATKMKRKNLQNRGYNGG